jgi:hypothetical protein
MWPWLNLLCSLPFHGLVLWSSVSDPVSCSGPFQKILSSWVAQLINSGAQLLCLNCRGSEGWGEEDEKRQCGKQGDMEMPGVLEGHARHECSLWGWKQPERKLKTTQLRDLPQKTCLVINFQLFAKNVNSLHGTKVSAESAIHMCSRWVFERKIVKSHRLLQHSQGGTAVAKLGWRVQQSSNWEPAWQNLPYGLDQFPEIVERNQKLPMAMT